MKASSSMFAFQEWTHYHICSTTISGIILRQAIIQHFSMDMSANGKGNNNLMIMLVELKAVFAAVFRINLKQTLEAI